MANFFDQFDGVVPESSGAANPFDEFDAAPKKDAPKPKKDVMRELNTKYFGDRVGGWLNTANDGILNFANAATLGIPGETILKDEVKESREESPNASTVGGVGGSVMAGGAISNALTKTVPALATATVPSMVGNQAATAMIQRGAEDGVKGEFNPLEIAKDGGIAAALTGILSPITRLFSGSKVGSAGKELSPEDIQRAKEIVAQGQRAGIPLTVPEAVTAAAPGRAGDLNAIADTASQRISGSKEAANFAAGRIPTLNDAVTKFTGNLGPGVADATEASGAATKAIGSAKKLVEGSADLEYAKDVSKLVPGAPKNALIDRAWNNIQRDPVLKAEVGGNIRHSVAGQDAIKKEVEAILAGSKGNSPVYKRVGPETAEAIKSGIDSVTPHNAAGRQITRDGMRMVEGLESGPLGTILAGAKPGTQAKSLLDVATPEAGDMAIDAVKRLNIAEPGVAERLFNTRAKELAARNDPMAFGKKLLPTDESTRVATEVIGPGRMAEADDILSSLRRVNPNNAKPIPERSGSPLGGIWDRLQDVGSRKTVKAFNDPATLDKLNKMSPGQRRAFLVTNGVATEYVDSILDQLGWTGSPK